MSLSHSPTDLILSHRSLFEQRLAVLDEALPGADESVRDLLRSVRASVVRLRTELDGIRLSTHSTRTTLRPACFDCGANNLEIFYASKHGQYHLCPSCFGVRQQVGQARQSDESVDRSRRQVS